MNFGEKVLNARTMQNLSQIELAEKTGVTERSIYSYEQAGVLPRMAVLRRLAAALSVSVSYLMDEDETDKNKDIDQDLFIETAKNEHGARGEREATELLTRASALFAGGDLEDDAKDVFFRSLMEVYLESKSDARKKFGKRRKKKEKKEK